MLSVNAEALYFIFPLISSDLGADSSAFSFLRPILRESSLRNVPFDSQVFRRTVLHLDGVEVALCALPGDPDAT